MKRFALALPLAVLLSLIPRLAHAQPHWGDFADGASLYFYTNTLGTDGVPETPVSETIAVYKDNSATEITTGVSIDDDFDSMVGFHQVTIDTTQTGFDVGSTYTIMYTAGTVDAVSIVGRVIGSFTLGRYLQPTTAGRRLDVTATGAAGIDWANIENPTANVNLEDTTVAVVTGIETNVNANVVLVGGSATPVTNLGIVFSTDFASNYNATADRWNTSVTHFGGTAGTFTGGIPAVNTTQLSGDATAADNAESAYDGNGYGDTIVSTTVTGSPINGDTTMNLNLPRPENNDLVGCVVVLRSATGGVDGGPAVSIRHVVSYLYDSPVGTLTIDSTPSFDLAAGAGVTILKPSFSAVDRTLAAAVKTKTDLLSSVIASGTALGGSTTTIVLAASEAFADNALTGDRVELIGGTGLGQSAIIASNVGATDTCTILGTWTAPDATSDYQIVGADVNIRAVNDELAELVDNSDIQTAQVHNEQPVDAMTSKLGTRADGVSVAFPIQRIVAGEINQVWIDCSRRTSGNLANVTNAASSNAAEIAVGEAGIYGRMVSFVLDATQAENGDTASITADVTPHGSQVLKVKLNVIVDDD